MTTTRVKATEEETKELRELANTASTTPVMLIGGVDLSASAWKRAMERCHEIALAHGLPEVDGYYGLNEEGEFVKAAGL